MKTILRLVIWIGTAVQAMTVHAQNEPIPIQWNKATYSPWVERTMAKMTMKEKIGQLFFVAVPAMVNPVSLQPTLQTLRNHHPGGVVFFKNSPENIIRCTQMLQQASTVPLAMCIDGEWGLGMRMPAAISYPLAMTLGAIQANEYIQEMGFEIARQLQHIGIQINLAPVADANTEPANPVIGRRSFGENPVLVADKAIAYMQGMQKAGMPAVGKHFPGHGDTRLDSHKALPVSEHTIARLDSIEFYPFKKLIEAGIMGIMSGHLSVPALDTIPLVPASLSRSMLTTLLKQQMGFKGFVITDAMNMKGVQAFATTVNPDLLALMAGNDIVELSENLPHSIDAVLEALNRNQITAEEIEQKCRKVLALKEWCGLTNFHPVPLDSALRFINRPYAHWLNQRLYDASVTVLKNHPEQLPLSTQTPMVTFGTTNNNFFAEHKRLKWIDHEKALSLPQGENLVVWVEKPAQVPPEWFVKATQKNKVILCYLGNPYQLPKLTHWQKAHSVIIHYQNNPNAQQAVIQLLDGKIKASGRLPVSIEGANELLKPATP